ncbi:hypothetical protein IE81DRAFT_246917 [Ceraceosorus guamensis]|uniref:Uncharacterized protein n=1 Tax=Ceraceosorus guamensis TaxID=1522189 RepID=A0A316VRQ9_9BASI|nr:hypothetical protein IE81DRAFT_246917 [Ceraceosorus guamensis]PWN40040.1 hypothetical protein IE81DRAFT_246917 [Ceraceosorus guamensis]
MLTEVTSPEDVWSDVASETLVIVYQWGITLVRPYFCLNKKPYRGQIGVGFIRYTFPESPFHTKDYSEEVLPDYILDAEMLHSSYSNGRVCQALVEVPFQEPSFSHLLLVDLNCHRLDTLFECEQHPFENIRAWRIETREESIETLEDGSLPAQEDIVLTDALQSLYMDASTIFTLRSQSGLQYIDFNTRGRTRSQVEDHMLTKQSVAMSEALSRDLENLVQETREAMRMDPSHFDPRLPPLSRDEA